MRAAIESSNYVSAPLNPSVPAERIHFNFLDGVRAVAVTLVVLFHFDLLGLPGGFLGVDMFFVISGFLVSDLILRNIASGDFSLLRFFERRIYRILPALYASLILVLFAGYFILLPTDFAQTAVSARASALLIANIHFHDTIEYFNQGSRFWMLLHHWSLSVEEQFYLIFPFLLVVLTALKVPLRLVIPVLLIAAFLYSMSLSHRAPSAAFYLVQARFWEFLVGAQIAVLPRTFTLSRTLAETISAIAIAAILISSRWITDPADLYRLATAIPVAATAAIIWANINTAGTVAGQLLSVGWIRKIGLISYSMYILHWPFILFAQYWAVEPLPVAARIAVLAAMVSASWLSWRYIEQPFRKIPTLDKKSRQLGMLSVAATTAFIVLATSVIIEYKGFESRQSSEVTSALAAQSAYSPERKRCHSNEMGRAVSANEACVLGVTAAPSIAVWGDSHGVELAYALAKAMEPKGRALIQLTSSGCPPVKHYTPLDVPKCAQKNSKNLAYLSHNLEIKFVVIAMSNAYFQNKNSPQLAATILALRQSGKTVILVKAIPRALFNVPHAQARSAYYDRSEQRGSSILARHRSASAAMSAQIAALNPGSDLIIVDPADDFCDGSRCYHLVQDQMLYFDDNHPSLFGAQLIADRIARAIPAAAR